MDSKRIDAPQAMALLRRLLLAHMPGPGNYPAAVPGLCRYRRDADDLDHQPIVYEPVAIVIAQGEKSVRIGPDALRYGEGSCFVTGVDMPTSCAVQGASPQRPFLAFSLDLDVALAARLLNGMAGVCAPAEEELSRPAMAMPLDPGLLDAFLRLLEIAEDAGDAAVLAPLVIEEIHYRLLKGPFGARMRAFLDAESPACQIARAMRFMRASLASPQSVEEMAGHAHMAVSTFHKHFKAVCGLSPLQFLKRLRLERAQRLMLAGQAGVAEAALAVGYESPQQFSREYRRLFGEAPRRDVEKMRRPG